MVAFIGMVVDGVLRQEHGEGVIPQGNALYQLLKETGRLALLTDDENRAHTEHWLEVNGFSDHTYLMSPDATDKGLPAPERRLRQLRRLQRDAATTLALYVDPNPDAAAAALAEGICVMVFLHPKYARPSFRPDYEGAIRSWDVVTAEVDRQRLLKARDKRQEMEAL